MSKLVSSTAEAIEGITDGSSIAVGGFGICGTPQHLIRALREANVRDLHIVANNCGIDGDGLGLLLASGQIGKVTCSYIGGNREFSRQISAGKIELDLVPQGTLVERLRAGGAGIPAFYTPTGAGTAVATGGIPALYQDGSVMLVSEPKETRRLGGLECVLEQAIRCDFALLHAWHGDEVGNLVFRRAAQNFNPVCAMAGAVSIAEVETLAGPAAPLEPDRIHLPAPFIDRVIHVDDPYKPIENLVTRSEEGTTGALG